ncbi:MULTISPECIES: SRPBCC family protein [unclassified Streptomyces]|uniref:SRPBCC family protein n=1 Tax=unclassified Streptomyces TaxID=2593676 RepID=UPI001F03C944|nr:MULTISPECIES: SRPBCC family protein [unclassified Streptomyces]MCH0562987.1 SRPBCC family protein [Streptomyces sp. MUM 2J]MCH0571947.1 SRPBCC family protein [Streptomyces sp. MUM 136J]
MVWIGALAAVTAAGTGAAAGYLGLVTGALPLDIGVGRRTRLLGPRSVDIAAPRDVVFDVIAQPYLGRATRAMREKVTVLEQGSDLVLAAHRTPVAGGRLTATTVETVRFTHPERIDFRLVRGPVPAVTETFELTEEQTGTRLVYRGELGTDLWRLGRWWGDVVAPRWEAAVGATLTAVGQEAERRASRAG